MLQCLQHYGRILALPVKGKIRTQLSLRGRKALIVCVTLWLCLAPG